MRLKNLLLSFFKLSMNKVFTILLVAFSHILLSQTEQYSRAKILFTPDKTILDVQRVGVAVDHGEYKKGVSFTSDFSDTEIEKLKQAGFTVEILIADVQKHYREQNIYPSTISKKKQTQIV